ncbi:MAG TPA: translocation/assembly module TamB domain-containing protein [Burkholderiales bacterium]|nr:translocation/assembly module TamB domain-containing protein [Burkholderiales bacterium]
MALLLAAAVGFICWLFATEPGLQWALRQAEQRSGGKLAFEGVRGTLANIVEIERVRFDSGGTVVEARGVAGHGHLAAALGGRLVVEPLRIASLDIAMTPDDKPTPASPVALPFGIRLGELQLDRLHIQLPGATYEFANLRFDHVGLNAPSGVSAQGSFEFQHDQYPVAASLTLGGTLEELNLHLKGTAAGIPADVRGLVTPSRPQKVKSAEVRAGPLDLAQLNAELPHAELELALRATGTAKGFAGTLEATNKTAGPLDRQRLPLARAQTTFSTDLQSFELEKLQVMLAGGGTLEGRGVASASGFEGEVKASRLNLRGLRSDLRETALSGPLELSLGREVQTVRGTLSQPGMSVTAEVARKGDDIDIRRLHAAAEGGEVSGSGKVRLGEPIGFDAKLALSGFNPAAFGDYPAAAISGTVAGKGNYGKDIRADVEWSLADSNLYGEPLHTNGKARVAGKRVLDANADATLADTHATIRGAFGGAGDRLAWTLEAPKLEEHVEGMSGRLKASGSLGGTWENPSLVLEAQGEELEFPHGLKASRANAEFAGTATRHAAQILLRVEGTDIQARLAGSFKGGQWTGDILALEGNGRVPFVLRAPAPLKASRQRVELGYVAASVGDGRLLVKELLWSKERVASVGEFSGLPAQWLITALGQSAHLRSTLLLDGQWEIAAAPTLSGTLSVRRTAGDLTIVGENELELGLQGISLDARFAAAGVGVRLDVASSYASGTLAGQIGRDPDAGALTLGKNSPLSAQGQIELAHAKLVAEPFLADSRFDGRIGADVEISGTLADPVFAGALRGDAIAFDYPPLGIYLKNGQFRARLAGDALQVESLSIQAGSGTFTASGTLPLRLAEGSNARLTWQARHFALLERPDMRIITSGEGDATFDGQRLAFSGELRVERGHIQYDTQRVPKLGDDVVVAGEKRPTARARSALPVDLNLDLDLGSNLTIAMQGLEGKLGGRVNVSTTKEGELRLYGRLQTLNATFYAYGQKLQVDPGIVIFDGPPDNPALQITAWRRNQAVEAGVQISGTVRAPRVQLVSQPPVSEGERLSWLVLGRAPTDATKADLGLLQAAAGALLSRGDSLPLDRRIARSFGLDEISFRGSGQTQDSVVAVGKRFSDKLYLSYEQGIGTVASSLVKLDYALSRRWSARIETGTSTGGGIFYRFSWD